MTEPLLAVDALTVSFRTDDGTLVAVDGVAFAVERGECLGVVGESGSGKSVSALAILGLLPEHSATVAGSARLEGAELVGSPERAMQDVRGRRISMVFQDPMTSLNPVLRVGAQVAEVLVAHGIASRAEARARAVGLLDVVGIPDPGRRAREYPHQLSGGMRQRVMIAMAMACEPGLLIADEPTTALDVTVQAQVLDVLDRLRADVGMALLLITHDLGVVAGRCDRVLVMYAGRVVESGPTDAVFASPRMPYTLGLLHSSPGLEGEAVARLTPIPGQPPSLLALPSGCPFRPRCDFVHERCAEERPELLEVGAGHFAACHFSGELDAVGQP